MSIVMAEVGMVVGTLEGDKDVGTLEDTKLCSHSTITRIWPR